MKKNIILSVVCGMVAMASLTSCNDFLQVSATNQKEMDKSFTTYDELRLATAYLYMKPWFGFHSTRLFAMGDARGNNIYGDNNNETGYAPYCLFTDKPNTPGLADAWNSLYIVVTTSLTIMHHRDANISVKHKRMLAREKHVSCGRRLITIWLLTGTMCPLWRIQLLIRKLSIWLPHASRM